MTKKQKTSTKLDQIVDLLNEIQPQLQLLIDLHPFLQPLLQAINEHQCEAKKKEIAFIQHKLSNNELLKINKVLNQKLEKLQTELDLQTKCFKEDPIEALGHRGRPVQAQLSSRKRAQRSKEPRRSLRLQRL